MDKKFLHDLLPPVAIRLLSGIVYGWHGSYSSWEEAASRCEGYDSEIILSKVSESARKVITGEAVYERDSVIFDKVQYSFPLLSALLSIALKNNGKLRIIDFGGSLGTTYYQNKAFVDNIADLHWCVIEQPSFVTEGKRAFETERLHFFTSIEECLERYPVDTILFSSVLQYLEKPFDMLEKVFSLGIPNLIIDRTPFIHKKNRLTIQKVNPKIYKASYPCWFFNKEEFLSKTGPFYNLVLEFEALDRANIQSEFLGFLFEKIR